jgi:hypothetical protein
MKALAGKVDLQFYSINQQKLSASIFSRSIPFCTEGAKRQIFKGLTIDEIFGTEYIWLKIHMSSKIDLLFLRGKSVMIKGEIRHDEWGNPS